MKRIELMIGKLLPWTLVAFLDVALITILGRTLFGIPLRGAAPAFALGAMLFVFASLGMGLLISALAPTLDTANMIALLVAFLPSFLLSGFAFALDQIPVWLQWVSYGFPARYMVTISRGVFLKGAGFTELWPEMAALALYALIMVLVSSLLYGRRSSR